MADFKDLDIGWSWVVMLACFVSLFVIGGTNYTVGLVHNILLEKYNQSHTTTVWVSATHSSISNLAGKLYTLSRSTIIILNIAKREKNSFNKAF